MLPLLFSLLFVRTSHRCWNYNLNLITISWKQKEIQVFHLKPATPQKDNENTTKNKKEHKEGENKEKAPL